MRFLTHGGLRDPFTALDWLRGEMDRLLEDSLPEGHTGAWRPPLSVHETESAYEVRLPVPGADPQKLDVSVERDVLTVSGERPGIPEDAQRRFLGERFSGRFERSLEMPARVDPQGVQAHYEAGVLRVQLPKAEEARPRRIEVHIG